MASPRLRAPLCVCLAVPALLAAQQPRPDTPAMPTIAARTVGLERRDGFVPVVLDRRTGSAWLQLPAGGTRLLLCATLATGLGSNPVGLDRGKVGGCYVARFQPVGSTQILVLENWRFRSTLPGNPAHAKSVEEAFAPSTVASLPVVAQDSGRVLVDAAELLRRDWLDVAGTLEQTGQGGYAVGRERSFVYEPATRAYPQNTELEMALSFEAKARPGAIVATIAPDGRAFTVRQHLTLAPLPDDGYRPRDLDPRMNFFSVDFKDYAQPVEVPLERHWIARHRLERENPSDPRSPIRNPIVYYVDRGIPEPIRTATLEGARFWVEAFDHAGLKGGFRVELLPEGADPMDIRYNVVQWENRNERGWSFGEALVDPRTGEIVKGLANMDSHRGRTAYNLVAALAGAETAADTHFVLGRVRQVTAHEIGHTLGMAHNYIASSYGRGSVMDYPAPRVRLGPDGEIDLSDAYATGPGKYDVLAVRWGYGIFPPDHEADSLRAIVSEALRDGLLFLSDADARPDFASDPRTNLWDDQATPEAFLRDQLAVRRRAMAQFGLRNIRNGEPVATLQERFAPLYFFHRFAVRSVAKVIGGVEYQNAVAGDGQQETHIIPGPRQRAALLQLLGSLAPRELSIPDTVLILLGPRPFGYPDSVELFRSRAQPIFDEFGAAGAMAWLVLDPLLQRNRLARLIQQAAHDRSQLSLGELLATMKAKIWDAPPERSPRDGALRRVVQLGYAERLIGLAADTGAAGDVRAAAELMLGTLRSDATRRSEGVGAPLEARAHWRAIAAEIAAWQRDRTVPAANALPAPPGDPFGVDDEP